MGGTGIKAAAVGSGVGRVAGPDLPRANVPETRYDHDGESGFPTKIESGSGGR